MISANNTYANSVVLRINEEYIEEAYESCKEVSMPSSSDTVIASACGQYGVFCNAERCNIAIVTKLRKIPCNILITDFLIIWAIPVI